MRWAGLIVVLTVASVACGTSDGTESGAATVIAATPARAAGEPIAIEPTTTVGPQPLECIAAWPLSDRVGQMLVSLVTEQQLPALVEMAPTSTFGGLVVIGQPTAGIADLLRAAQDASVVPLLVAIDDEGGKVNRLVDTLGPAPSAAALAGTGDPDAAAFAAAVRATDLAHLGFTMNLAPVVDVGGGEGIGSRSFGTDPAVVTQFANAYAEGIMAAGLVAVAKHFPGHGSAGVDSHDALPVTDGIETLRQRDLLPFENLDDRVAVMVGHLDVPDLTDGLPASLSRPAVTDLLRTELDFDGLVMTDALNMRAILDRWTVTEAAVLAAWAGVDVVMVGSPLDITPTHAALMDALAAGLLDEKSIDESVARILAVKNVSPCGA